MFDRLYVALQYILPQHLLSRLMYLATRSEWRPWKRLLIHSVIQLYKVDMQEAADPDPESYASFNDFFTRPLRTGCRPLPAASDRILCPADGALSQFGSIRDDRLLQAKGHDYSLLQLLGGDREWSERFRGGHFATIYLAPRDYHRVHMPRAGRLHRMIHVPGRLFSVNPTTTRLVPSLFTRNERVVSLFESDSGPMAVILVGAIFVSSVDTVWAGSMVRGRSAVKAWDYAPGPDGVVLGSGAEMGRFNMGSTVILLFGPDRVSWSRGLVAEMPVRMGQPLGRIQDQSRSAAT